MNKELSWKEKQKLSTKKTVVWNKREIVNGKPKGIPFVTNYKKLNKLEKKRFKRENNTKSKTMKLIFIRDIKELDNPKLTRITKGKMFYCPSLTEGDSIYFYCPCGKSTGFQKSKADIKFFEKHNPLHITIPIRTTHENKKQCYFNVTEGRVRFLKNINE